MREIHFESKGEHLYAVADGTGPVLLFYHGVTSTHASMRESLKGLTDSYTVLTPDARGHGNSLCVDSARYTWQQYADDVVALMDHLELEQAIVGGVSFGAAISTAAVLRQPARFTAMILAFPALMDTVTGWTRTQKPVMDARRRSVVATLQREGIEAAVDAWVEARGDGDAAKSALKANLYETWSHHDPMSFTAFMRAFHSDKLGHPVERLDDLKNINIPVLIIPGDDNMHPHEVAKAYGDVLPGAICGGHEIAKEAADPAATNLQDELLARTIRIFLEEHSA